MIFCEFCNIYGYTVAAGRQVSNGKCRVFLLLMQLCSSILNLTFPILHLQFDMLLSLLMYQFILFGCIFVKCQQAINYSIGLKFDDAITYTVH